jgi:uracil-DNA glycosylase family 4
VTAVVDPLAAAATARSWPQLAALVRTCVACPELVAGRTQVVPGLAPPGADVLLVGEAPGAQEDAGGVPFVGRAGQLLDTLLAEVGLSRDRVAVTNVLKCRPPANRKPRRGEVARCRPWLERQIALLEPSLIVALGGTAAEWFAGPSARIASLRGQPLSYDGRPVLVTYHPSAAIRFGPAGAPLAALREDLAEVAGLLGVPPVGA